MLTFGSREPCIFTIHPQILLLGHIWHVHAYSNSYACTAYTYMIHMILYISIFRKHDVPVLDIHTSITRITSSKYPSIHPKSHQKFKKKAVASTSYTYCWWFRNPANQLRLVSLSHYLRDFILPRWLGMWFQKINRFFFGEISQIYHTFLYIYIQCLIPPIWGNSIENPSFTEKCHPSFTEPPNCTWLGQPFSRL